VETVGVNRTLRQIDPTNGIIYIPRSETNPRTDGVCDAPCRQLVSLRRLSGGAIQPGDVFHVTAVSRVAARPGPGGQGGELHLDGVLPFVNDDMQIGSPIVSKPSLNPGLVTLRSEPGLQTDLVCEMFVSGLSPLVHSDQLAGAVRAMPKVGPQLLAGRDQQTAAATLRLSGTPEAVVVSEAHPPCFQAIH
jgi:hypothetical protein